MDVEVAGSCSGDCATLSELVMYTCGGWLVVVLKDPPSSCRGRLVEDFEFDRRELVGSSRGKTRDTLGVCDLMLASPGVAACGIPRSQKIGRAHV